MKYQVAIWLPGQQPHTLVVWNGHDWPLIWPKLVANSYEEALDNAERLTRITIYGTTTISGA